MESSNSIDVPQVPNFGQLMALVGASCCTLLAYIMPALCHLVLFRLEYTYRVIFLTSTPLKMSPEWHCPNWLGLAPPLPLDFLSVVSCSFSSDT